MIDLRPLDPLRSIKTKLGVLVAASVSVASIVIWYGLIYLGWLPRYTLPVAVLLALVVTQVLARGMTAPLRSMTAAARAMATGDYSRRVLTRSRDEVGQLAEAFNRMAADLETSDAQRRELIANVSHELRTPISALQAILENAADGVRPPDPQTMRLALTQTERLGRLVTELLDLSRIDAGTAALTRADILVRPMIDAAVAETTLLGRDVHFETAVTPTSARAWADPARLHQVLANLLDNAARHSPPGGTVGIRARGGDGGLRIEVTDDGPGIAQQDRERVFERFYRGTGDSTGSTGLGLAIARWAVSLHGGRIRVGDAPSSGCQFVVELPPRGQP